MSRGTVTIFAFWCYTVTFSIGGLFVAWSLLPLIASVIVTFLAVLFWPHWISGTLLSTPGPRTFSGQIDHPGGGIGLVISMCASLLLLLDGNDIFAIICLLLGIPVLGISFSLLSEWLECRIIDLRYQRLDLSSPSHSTNE